MPEFTVEGRITNIQEREGKRGSWGLALLTWAGGQGPESVEVALFAQTLASGHRCAGALANVRVAVRGKQSQQGKWFANLSVQHIEPLGMVPNSQQPAAQGYPPQQQPMSQQQGYPPQQQPMYQQPQPGQWPQQGQPQRRPMPQHYEPGPSEVHAPHHHQQPHHHPATPDIYEEDTPF